MKRLAFAASVLVLVSACNKADTVKTDTAAPAMAPAMAPAAPPMDTAAMKAMAADSARKADSAKMAAASAKKPAAPATKKKGGG